MADDLGPKLDTNDAVGGPELSPAAAPVPGAAEPEQQLDAPVAAKPEPAGAGADLPPALSAPVPPPMERMATPDEFVDATDDARPSAELGENGSTAPVCLGSPIDDIKELPSKEKHKPTALQLDDMPPPPSRASIEVSSAAVASAAVSRSRASSRASVQKRPWTPSLDHPPDSPTSSLISSLRQQLEMLSDQANLLNSKLVDSISKHADLEDQIFGLQSEKSQQEHKIDELERAKAQWEESMNTGLLVERSQIRDEMQRLAAGLVEEEKRRGTEEERRQQVESEVDQLTASLFDQANTMVASERMARVQAEQREKVTVENLAAAEAAIKDMQQHLQSVEGASGESRSGPVHQQLPRRYLSSHPPYAEFLSLLSHLRALRPRTARARELYPAPAVPNLLAQPFLARAVAEDHEPTLRLDAAPDLSWLSRRNVGSAIIAGDLLIEPAPAASLGPLDTINCAMCGCTVFQRPGQAGPGAALGSSSSRFSLKPFFSPASSQGPPPSPSAATQLYVFRIASEDSKAYPLCKNGWCLERLRSACALWHFVRTGIVTPVWQGEDGHIDAPAHQPQAAPGGLAVPPEHSITVTADDLLGEQHPRIAQRSVSQPNAPTRPLATPPQSEKKSSGWGIGGFKLGGGWSSSRPQTPSIASTTEERSDPKKDDSVYPDAVTPRSLAAEKPGTDADSTRAVIDPEDRATHIPDPEEDEKPEATPLTPGREVEAKEQADARMRSPSFATSDSEYSFATPPNEPKELPAEEETLAVDTVTAKLDEATLDEAKEDDAEVATTAATVTPSASTTPDAPASTTPETEVPRLDIPAEAAEPGPRKRAAPPPPLPKRSERRALPGSRPGSAATTPTGASTPIPALASTPTAAASGAAEGADSAQPEGGVESPLTPTTPRHPPPPPRHFAASSSTPGATASAAAEAASSPRSPREAASASPRASTASPRASVSNGPPRVAVSRHVSTPTSAGGEEPPAVREKTFLAGDEWEVRAWKQVVRLKQDMWRARVGVVDDV